MKKFFQKIGAFIALLLGNAKKFEAFLVDHVDEAIVMVDQIRRAVNSPVVNTAVLLLPIKYRLAAEKVQKHVANAIDRVLDELGIATICFEKPTTHERLLCFIDHLKTLKPAMQDALQVKFAQLYVKYKSETELKQSTIDTIVQSRFLEQKFQISDDITA